MIRPRLRTTHTFATLPVSKRTFEEIHRKLKAASYDHSFIDEETIDMDGIGITYTPPTPKKKKPIVYGK
jgi:hypothetical protein